MKKFFVIVSIIIFVFMDIFAHAEVFRRFHPERFTMFRKGEKLFFIHDVDIDSVCPSGEILVCDGKRSTVTRTFVITDSVFLKGQDSLYLQAYRLPGLFVSYKVETAPTSYRKSVLGLLSDQKQKDFGIKYSDKQGIMYPVVKQRVYTFPRLVISCIFVFLGFLVCNLLYKDIDTKVLTHGALLPIFQLCIFALGSISSTHYHSTTQAYYIFFSSCFVNIFIFIVIGMVRGKLLGGKWGLQAKANSLRVLFGILLISTLCSYYGLVEDIEMTKIVTGSIAGVISLFLFGCWLSNLPTSAFRFPVRILKKFSS